LVAILSNIVEPDFAKRKLVPRIKNLCRDFNWEVRKAITSHLYKIFNLFTPEETEKQEMYEIMTELLDDEENEVKNLAIEVFFKNLHKFTDERVEE
jgi:Glu-tRNA(Gln) amidotransferase subunit E-like FAD-binding protein